MDDETLIERLRAAPRVAQWIVRTLEDHGFETWAVGGAVRDAALGVDNQDWDFATLARPDQVQQVFRRTVAVGADHGTIGVLGKDRHMYEVTTFRRDVKPLGRRAVVEFADTLEEDLARRDFTLNAIAWHPFREEIRDPFGGLEDLRAGILRTVGDPDERFREDRLRVLRGLRFAARYELDVTPPTWSAMCSAASELRQLSAERVREELMKVLGGLDRPSSGLSSYRSAGVTEELFPEFDRLTAEVVAPARSGGDPSHESGGPVSRWDRALVVADALPKSAPLHRMAALLTEVVEAQDLGAGVGLLTRLKFSRADTDRLMIWSQSQRRIPASTEGAPALRRWLADVEPDARRGALRLAVVRARADATLAVGSPGDVIRSVCAIRAELREHPPLAVADLEIDGRDVMRLGVRPGPQIGVILRALLETVLDDPDQNERDRLLTAAAGMIEEMEGP